AQAATEKEDFDLSSFQTTAATGENIRKPQKAKNPRIAPLFWSNPRNTCTPATKTAIRAAPPVSFA
ncbi:MAG: hypothetical protein ACPG6U_09825, partial [Paracoccaceae bacterium]